MKIMQVLKNKKGFTLMELIIVLVILAILAAAILPSFLNFVTDAGRNSLLAEARLGQVAAQVMMTESANSLEIRNSLQDNPMGNDRFRSLIDHDIGEGGVFSDIEINDIGRVVGLTYTRDGRSVTIDDGQVTD